MGCGGACRIERRLESIHHLMARLGGLEQAHRAFEAKDLLNAFPVLAKPVLEIRTTGESLGVLAAHALCPRSRLESFGDNPACDPQTHR